MPRPRSSFFLFCVLRHRKEFLCRKTPDVNGVHVSFFFSLEVSKIIHEYKRRKDQQTSILFVYMNNCVWRKKKETESGTEEKKRERKEESEGKK